jgi:hypothetical protein
VPGDALATSGAIVDLPRGKIDTANVGTRVVPNVRVAKLMGVLGSEWLITRVGNRGIHLVWCLPWTIHQLIMK